MEFNYLRYLAKIGASHIHPYEKRATEILVRELNLNHGHAVLEIGCGTGGTIIKLASRYNVHIYGVDKLDEMLAVARKRIRLTGLSNRTCLFKANLSALPFGHASLDRVYAESVLGILNSEQVEYVLEEAYRVLNRQGIIVLNDAIWKASVSPEQVQAINSACLEDFGLIQASETGWSMEDWIAIFQRHGFQASSFLIEDDLHQGNDLKLGGMNRQELVSEAITMGYKIWGYLNRGLLADKKRYKSMLEKHRNDGKFIESRIFVLRKV